MVARRLTLARRAPLALVAIVTLALVGWSGRTKAQAPAPGSGALGGTVTADRGEVRALRVKARDTVRRVTYTVFTNKGRYQFNSLPAGTYEVRVVEEDFDSPTITATVAAGQTQTGNLALKGHAESSGRGAGQAGSIAQTSYGATPQDRESLAKVELVDFDTLYPPGPVRDLMVENCFSCHGISGWHGRRMNETGWRRVVNRMFAKDARVANMAVGVPQITESLVSNEQKEQIIKYLTANFGPGSKPRDLKTDVLVRDEDGLNGVLYVQYELNRVRGSKFANGREPDLGGHSAFASLAEPGIVYFSGNSTNSIVRVDTRDPNFETRTKEFRVENPGNINTTPHGIVEVDGRIWFTELGGDRISMLDPKTGQMQRYRIPTEGAGPHSLWNDSKGNFWYTHFAASGKIGRFDAKTQQVKEYEPIKDFSGYGLVVDKQDRVWAVGLNKAVVVGYDPKTDKWTSYKISGAARRVAVDDQGRVWACMYFGNRIAMIEPASGKVTEYELPLKYGNPYDLWPDADGNIWVENAVYNSLVKFEPKTQKWTYVPFPEVSAHTPKLDRGRDGTIWFTLARPVTLTAFKPKGNLVSNAR
jgi:virginiamycin B lyase